MKKWFVVLSPFILMSSVLNAWGGKYTVNSSKKFTSDQPVSDHFPLDSEQGWFLEESYLLMKPFLGDLEYGNAVSAQFPTESSSNYKIRVKDPDFEWNSGVRIGIGRYLPNHDKWDISLYTTYFYGDASNETHKHFDKGTAIAASYGPFLSFLSNKSHNHWWMNYFVWDLMLGRQFSMTSRASVHPYIGLRAGLIYNDFSSTNQGEITASAGGVVTQGAGRARMKISNNFWSVGPRVGSHFNYKFTGQWSFLGNLATSFLYGRYHVKERSQASIFSNGNTLNYNFQSKDHDDTIRINLEGAIGMGWEAWFKNHTIRLAPTVMYEGILWFDMNDFFKPSTAFSQDKGNLGLMGLTFNLQLDF